MSIPSMSKEERLKLSEKAKGIKPLVWVGKNGITDEIIAQVSEFLKKRKLVKVKMLNSYVDDHDKKVAAMLAHKSQRLEGAVEKIKAGGFEVLEGEVKYLAKTYVDLEVDTGKRAQRFVRLP